MEAIVREVDILKEQIIVKQRKLEQKLNAIEELAAQTRIKTLCLETFCGRLEQENQYLKARLSQSPCCTVSSSLAAAATAELEPLETGSVLSKKSHVTQDRATCGPSELVPSGSSQYTQQLTSQKSGFLQTECFYRIPSMKFVKDVGKGCNGRVSLVEVAGTLCIAKRPRTLLQSTNQYPANQQVDFYRELQVLPSLHHPNIVQCMGVYCTTDPRDDLALIVEYIPFDLDRVLSVCCGQFPVSLQLSVLLDVSLGVHYLHSRAIVHCDLTPDNVLLSLALSAKISDLGSSHKLGSRDAKGYSPTTVPRFWTYMPPEVFTPNFLYTETVDSFSFGVLSLFVATQVFPERYMGDSISQEAVDNKEIELERHSRVFNLLDEEHCLVTLIKRCVRDVPSERPGSGDIISSLKEWIKHYPKGMQDVMLVNRRLN